MAAKKAKKKAAKVVKAVKAVKKATKSPKITPKKASPKKLITKPTAKTVTRAKVTLFPSGDGVLVERIQESDRTPGGLYIPATAMEKPLKGLVVQAGRGKFNKKGKLKPLDVQVGDEVLFGKFAGTEITVDGANYLLVREDDILGVVS